MSPQIIPTAEPFFFPGGPMGCMQVENSGHVIPREPERLRVFQAVQAFVERVCKVPA